MERNFEQYTIEQLKVPTLIIHAKDDPIYEYAKVEAAIPRFPNLELKIFPDGGHLMQKHSEEIEETLEIFLTKHK